jgi:hypothetical protein
MIEKEKQLFDILVKYFDIDTCFSSRFVDEHPYYKTIVNWGKAKPDDLIPVLLELLPENWHWSHALWDIIGQEKGPHIPEEYAGQGDFIAQAWLDWGRANDYL